MRAYSESFPTMQVASVHLGLVSTQAPLIFRSTVTVIVEFVHAYYEERREEAYARNELNIRANAPSPHLSKSSVQKGGRIFGSLRYSL